MLWVDAGRGGVMGIVCVPTAKGRVSGRRGATANSERSVVLFDAMVSDDAGLERILY